MKLLFLSKRRPMGRDLLSRPYGRFYHLPRILAQRGHEVNIILCSYFKGPDLFGIQDDVGIRWSSLTLLGPNPLVYYREAFRLAEKNRPDWIIGFSDTYYGIIAQHLSRRLGLKSLIDAYDNYEGYMPWNLPLHVLWRRALAGADMITAAGPQLAALMGRQRSGKPGVVVPMAADPNGFKSIDKQTCRQSLGLPLNRKLIGYCGSLHANRGLEVLFDAYRLLAQDFPELELVVSGKKARNVVIPEGVRYLGYLPDEQMPILLNSMDVLSVINQDSAFGNYSYPVKLYEAMCCRVPIAATATPATEWILAEHPDLLVPPGDSEALCRTISRLLQTTATIDYGKEEGWRREAMLFEEVMASFAG